MQNGNDDSLNEWVARLRDDLNERGQTYQKFAKARNLAPETWVETEEGDIHPIAGTTLAMAGVMSVVCSAIQDLPAMRDNPGFEAIHDLLCALIDLAQGLKPPLLTPGPKVEEALRVSRGTVQANAVLFVRTLKLSGHCKYGEARDKVAEILRDAGFRGHKGGPISATTLQTWHDNYTKHIMPEEFRDYIDRSIQQLKASPGWPPPLPAVLAAIKDTAKSEWLRNKYGAPPGHHI